MILISWLKNTTNVNWQRFFAQFLLLKFLFPESGCEKRLRPPPLLLFCISALTYLKFVAEPHKFDLEQKCLWGSLQSLLHLAPFSKVKHKFIANSICKSPVYISSCFDLFRRQGIVWLNPLEEEDQPMGCGLPDRSLATYLEIVCLQKLDIRKDTWLTVVF